MTPIEQFAVRSRDAELLKRSTSGGAFTEMARVVLAQNGAVYGAGWEPDTFRVVHKRVDSEEGLAELRGSKYVHSDMSAALPLVRQDLDAGRKVLFTGVPCQTAALRKMFGDGPNLLLCAIMCHCTVEPGVWARYLEDVRTDAQSPIRRIRFRDKVTGWDKSRFVIEFDDSFKNICQTPAENAYMQAFYCGLGVRTCCLDCAFRNGKGGMDLMIGDCWGIETIFPEWNDDRGVNAALVYTENGRRLLEATGLMRVPISYEQIFSHNPCLEHSIRPDLKCRRRFLRTYGRMGVARAVAAAFRRPFLVRLINRLKQLA